MKFRISRFRELTAAEVSRWTQWQETNPALVSPFFRPEFTRAVAVARDDVFVGILGKGEAFFPFQRDGAGFGHPVGGTLSDYHGVIGRTGFEWDAAQLVRNCGLEAWRFDHLPAAQVPFVKWHALRTESPVIDLLKKSEVGSAKLRADAANRRRKLERELGKIETEMCCADLAVLGQLFSWKSAQYLASGKKDLFAEAWVRSVVSEIWSQRGEGFSGSLAVLRAGGRVVAVDFGMRSRRILHSWFPAYDPELGVYSPGTILSLEIAATAADRGISTIDLGKGRAFYKQRLTNSAVPLGEGIVYATGLRAALRLGHLQMKEWIRSGPFYKPLRELRRWGQNGASSARK